MVRPFKRRSRFLLLALLLAVLLAGAGWLYFKDSNSNDSNSPQVLEHPEYLSFVGDYVFTVPTGRTVDDQVITGMQLVYSGSIANKGLDEVYAANNIGVKPLTDIKDHSARAFKKYVTDTFIPDVEKNLSTSDVELKFERAGDWDIARVTVKKDKKPTRFIYLKNGRHPVAIISKDETESFKKIAQTVTDVEKTDLKDERLPLKKAIQSNFQLLKDLNASKLYAQASPEFRNTTTESELDKAIKTVQVYSQGQILSNGGNYEPGEFWSVIIFVPLNKDFAPAPGVIFFIKIDGEWKLKGLSLPNPKPISR